MSDTGETSAVATVLRCLDEAYDHDNWYGPTLRSSVRGVSVDVVRWRPAATQHNIWEIVVHCAYWKHAVYRKLCGGKVARFPYGGAGWFARPAVDEGRRQWASDLALMDEAHAHLRDAVAAMDACDAAADERVRGVVMHDAYHAGQIQVLKRLYRSLHRS